MYKINKQLVQAILNYFAKKPYVEVWQLIQELQKVEEIKEEKKVEKKKD